MPQVEPYDRVRDARTYRGTLPAVAHPPCAQWGRLRGLAKANKEEAELAYFCLETVRRVGGVLEHPFPSLFFKKHLPQPGASDRHGFTTIIDQSWFGFPLRKRTQLYICGCNPGDLPPYPFELGDRFARNSIANLGTAHRARTYPALATWLVQVAQTNSLLDVIGLGDTKTTK